MGAITAINIYREVQGVYAEAERRMEAVSGIIQCSITRLGFAGFNVWDEAVYSAGVFVPEEYRIEVVYIKVELAKGQVMHFSTNSKIKVRNVQGKELTPQELDRIEDEDVEGLRTITINVQEPNSPEVKYELKVGYAVQVLDNIYYNVIYTNLIILAVAIAITFALAYIISQGWLRPVRRILSAMRKVEDGELKTKVEVDRSDELGRLQSAFNYMTEGLVDREFIKTTFKRYVTRQVAEEVLKHRENINLAGEKRNITILFSDIRGFTQMAEKMDPAEVLSMLNEYYGVMIDITFKYEGALDKFFGDGLMAYWNAPLDQDKPALKAVACALEMQKALGHLNKKRQTEGKDPIYIGIGINSGEAIAGNIGSMERMEYTVIGDNVNLAQRINVQTDRGQILISQSTYEAVADSVIATSLPPARVKGKSRPVVVWLLHDLKTPLVMKK